MSCPQMQTAPERLTAPDGVPRLVVAALSSTSLSVVPDSTGYTIDTTGVTAPEPGVGSVQLWDHAAQPPNDALEVAITTNTATLVVVQHQTQGVGDGEWIFDSIPTVETDPFEDLSVRFIA